MTTSRRKVVERELGEIDFYLPEITPGIDIEPVEEYIGSLFPTVGIHSRPPIFLRLSGSRLEDVATRLASSRVKDPSTAVQPNEPMYGEVDYERRAILGKAKLGGVVYDGHMVEAICLDLLKTRSSLGRCSIVLTDRLLSTYSQDDIRHHLRTVVCGFPSLISIPGVVEAPAKPKEYYFMRQQLEAAGAGEHELLRLRSAFKGRFIDYDDPSISEVLKGLALQAVMFHMTLDPFCSDRHCRLFNSHWQEELIESQVRSQRLCGRHAKLVKCFGKRPRLAW